MAGVWPQSSEDTEKLVDRYGVAVFGPQRLTERLRLLPDLVRQHALDSLPERKAIQLSEWQVFARAQPLDADAPEGLIREEGADDGGAPRLQTGRSRSCAAVVHYRRALGE